MSDVPERIWIHPADSLQLYVTQDMPDTVGYRRDDQVCSGRCIESRFIAFDVSDDERTVDCTFTMGLHSAKLLKLALGRHYRIRVEEA